MADAPSISPPDIDTPTEKSAKQSLMAVQLPEEWLKANKFSISPDSTPHQPMWTRRWVEHGRGWKVVVFRLHDEKLSVLVFNNLLRYGRANSECAFHPSDFVRGISKIVAQIERPVSDAVKKRHISAITHGVDEAIEPSDSDIPTEQAAQRALASAETWEEWLKSNQFEPDQKQMQLSGFPSWTRVWNCGYGWEVSVSDFNSFPPDAEYLVKVRNDLRHEHIPIHRFCIRKTLTATVLGHIVAEIDRSASDATKRHRLSQYVATIDGLILDSLAVGADDPTPAVLNRAMDHVDVHCLQKGARVRVQRENAGSLSGAVGTVVSASPYAAYVAIDSFVERGDPDPFRFGCDELELIKEDENLDEPTPYMMAMDFITPLAQLGYRLDSRGAYSKSFTNSVWRKAKNAGNVLIRVWQLPKHPQATIWIMYQSRGEAALLQHIDMVPAIDVVDTVRSIEQLIHSPEVDNFETFYAALQARDSRGFTEDERVIHTFSESLDSVDDPQWYVDDLASQRAVINAFRAQGVRLRRPMKGDRQHIEMFWLGPGPYSEVSYDIFIQPTAGGTWTVSAKGVREDGTTVPFEGAFDVDKTWELGSDPTAEEVDLVLADLLTCKGPLEPEPKPEPEPDINESADDSGAVTEGLDDPTELVNRTRAAEVGDVVDIKCEHCGHKRQVFKTWPDTRDLGSTCVMCGEFQKYPGIVFVDDPGTSQVLIDEPHIDDSPPLRATHEDLQEPDDMDVMSYTNTTLDPVAFLKANGFVEHATQGLDYYKRTFPTPRPYKLGGMVFTGVQIRIGLNRQLRRPPNVIMFFVGEDDSGLPVKDWVLPEQLVKHYPDNEPIEDLTDDYFNVDFSLRKFVMALPSLLASVPWPENEAALPASANVKNTIGAFIHQLRRQSGVPLRSDVDESTDPDAPDHYVQSLGTVEHVALLHGFSQLDKDSNGGAWMRTVKLHHPLPYVEGSAHHSHLTKETITELRLVVRFERGAPRFRADNILTVFVRVPGTGGMPGHIIWRVEQDYRSEEAASRALNEGLTFLVQTTDDTFEPHKLDLLRQILNDGVRPMFTVKEVDENIDDPDALVNSHPGFSYQLAHANAPHILYVVLMDDTGQKSRIAMIVEANGVWAISSIYGLHDLSVIKRGHGLPAETNAFNSRSEAAFAAWQVWSKLPTRMSHPLADNPDMKGADVP